MITIYCVACAKEVEAQALFVDSIYPHRPDLYSKKFLQCPHCGNYVGTHQDGPICGTIESITVTKYGLIAELSSEELVDITWPLDKLFPSEEDLIKSL